MTKHLTERQILPLVLPLTLALRPTWAKTNSVPLVMILFMIGSQVLLLTAIPPKVKLLTRS